MEKDANLLNTETGRASAPEETWGQTVRSSLAVPQFVLFLIVIALLVIGGIISSTLLTLVVLPALYRMAHRENDSVEAEA